MGIEIGQWLEIAFFFFQFKAKMLIVLTITSQIKVTRKGYVYNKETLI